MNVFYNTILNICNSDFCFITGSSMPTSWREPVIGIIDGALQENEDLMALFKSLDISFDDVPYPFVDGGSFALPQDIVDAVNDATPDIIIRGLSSNQGDLVLKGTYFLVETVPGSGMFTNPWAFDDGMGLPYVFGGTGKFYIIFIYSFTSLY